VFTVNRVLPINFNATQDWPLDGPAVRESLGRRRVGKSPVAGHEQAPTRPIAVVERCFSRSQCAIRRPPRARERSA
jgi:hypothetical protein